MPYWFGAKGRMIDRLVKLFDELWLQNSPFGQMLTLRLLS